MAELAAIRGAYWVVSKALSPLSDGLVEAWAASSSLAPNIEAVKIELLYAQAMLDNARGREIHSSALVELLQKLRHLAYDADDVLDELDYFRIQDKLEGTFETVDRGCFHDLVRDARHTTNAGTKQLGCTPCYSVSLLPVHADTRTFITLWKKQSSKTPKLYFDRVNISKKMRHIVEQLQFICAKVSTILDLELLASTVVKLEFLGSLRSISNNATTSRYIMTTSESTEPQIFGRNLEKTTIIQYITKDVYLHQNLVVLPIVGSGGIGKTTLMQDIYNSKEVQAHFQIRVWICVSLDFNVYRLTKEILNSIPKAEDEKDEMDEKPKNLDCLQKLIEKRLKNKRFLVVLDDIWKKNGDEEWNKLLIPFTKGQVKGNTILVTTRFLDLAETVLKNVNKEIQLEALNPAEFWSFFMACVFGHDKTKHPLEENVLIPIGKQIVEKLKGNPLAAKTVGKLLRNNLTRNHWTRVLESKEWDSQSSDHDIMPALKLSYDYLPFHLQQCFSYCALYPEDYKFHHQELICFWIGLDILHSGHPNKTVEDIGHDNLIDLINYGFFRREIDDESNTYYVMHDLLHDLALKVSSQECLHIDSSRPTFVQIPPSIYHLSIKFNPPNSEDGADKGSEDGANKGNFMKELSKIRNRLKYESLRTLMIFGEYDKSFIVTLSDMFKDAQSLRVVRLPTVSHPKMKSIFDNFSKLLHLRYLKLELLGPWSYHFPTSLSRFYHLRVLDMRECYSDVNLSKDMANVSKLRHFLIQKDSLHSNISNVGKLRCLQELREFKVKKENVGFELKELGELEELGGSLSICNLEDVQVKGHEAKLRHKKCLQKLALNWKVNRSDKNPDTENQILESLQPHDNLCELKITGHGGPTCPTWLGTNLSIKGLEALCLDDVDWKMFPPLGELWLINESNEEIFACIRGQTFRKLKRLELIGLSKFRKWITQEVCPMFFSIMEVLIIKDCHELIELPFSYYTYHPLDRDETSTFFPRIREVKIENCLKLVSLPPIPYTQTLCSVVIRDVGTSLKVLDYQDNTSSSVLSIEGNMDVNVLDEKVLAFHNLTRLRNLKIKCFSPLAERHLRMLTSLKTLTINGSSVEFNRLESKSDIMWHLSIEYLNISNSHASGKELTQLLYHLPKLSNLSLLNCDKITQLCIVTEQQQTTVVVELEDNRPQVLDNQREKEEIVTQQSVDQEYDEGLLLFPAHLSDSLRKLVIEDCLELILALPTSHEEEIGQHLGVLQALCSLQTLDIRGCSKFLSAYKSSSCFGFPPSLQELYFTKEGIFIMPSRTTLHIIGWDSTCEGLWPLLTQDQLEIVTVWESNFFCRLGGLQEEQLLLLKRSIKLRVLRTYDISGFLVKPICSLLSSSLTKLQFYENHVEERFNEKQEEALQLLTSLQELEFWDCKKLQCLPAGLHRLTNLKKLEIWGCPSIRSLPKGGLPSSLEELVVSVGKKLQCLPAGLHRLTNLKKLEISCCPSIRSLPKGGLPSSLEELNVRYCGNKKLKQRCRKLMGTIPNICL
ncbi:hypothetical protein ABZP36_007747 [Zizania latifolia]